MIKYLFALIVLYSTSCLAVDFEEASTIAKQQFEMGDQSRIAYLNERMEYENEISLDEKGGCYHIPGNGITQVIRINSDGVVDLVVSSVSNVKSKCFRDAYVGTKYKAPPMAPIYQIMLMGYGHEAPKEQP